MTDSYIFDDNSLESKVLQHELSYARVIKVGSEYNLNKWLSEVIEETDEIIRVYLHFCSGTLVRPDIDIRTDIVEAHHRYPYLRIILPYEQMDRPTIERKAKEYGITNEIKIGKVIAEDVISSHQTGGKEGISEDFVQALIEEHKDKIKEIDFKPNYGKYSVGGNDSLRSEPRRKRKKHED